MANLIDSLHLRRRPHRQAAAAVAEKVGRLKLNERLTDSPMTPVLEVEPMRSAVVGKLGGWETLAALAPDLGLPVELFTTLAERAREHADLFGRLHHHVSGSAFRTGGKSMTTTTPPPPTHPRSPCDSELAEAALTRPFSAV